MGECEGGLIEPFERTDMSGTDEKMAVSPRDACGVGNNDLAFKHATKELA